MKRNWLFAFIAILTAWPVFAASLEDLIPGQVAALRAATGPITSVQTRNPTPQLLPRHTELARFVTGLQSSLTPNIFVESISLYHKPGSQGSAGWSKSEQIDLLNQVLAVSSLTGIQYYSESRKTMRIFYESSGVIDNPTNKRPLPDPVYTALPASITIHARQKDLTFGDNIYRYDYYTGEDAIFFVQENLTPMNTGIINAVGRNKFHMVTAIIDSGDYLLIYAAAMAKTVSLPGIGDRVGASFTNRANAILKWFTERANSVF